MILHGDSLEVLKTLDADSVDAVVCDPPYGLNFMGKKWDYDVPSRQLWEQVLRVLKPGGHVLSFGGTRTYHRLVSAIEDAGFEIRDQVQWIYGSGFPKSQNVALAIDKQAGAVPSRGQGFNVAGQNVQLNQNKELRSDHPDYQTPKHVTPDAIKWQGFGTALKPANEPIVLARKPLSESTVAKNVLKHGTGALNIDGSRIGVEQTETRRGVTQTGPGGWKTTGFETPQVKLNPPGRWPANVLFDEESAALLDEQSGVLAGDSANRKPRNNQNPTGNGITHGHMNPIVSTGFVDKGGASRFFYCAKASKAERNRGLEGMPEGTDYALKSDAPEWVRAEVLKHVE